VEFGLNIVERDKWYYVIDYGNCNRVNVLREAPALAEVANPAMPAFILEMSLLRQEAVHSGGTSGTLSGHLCIDAISRHSLSSIGELCRPASDESVTLANQPRVRFPLVADWRSVDQKSPGLSTNAQFRKYTFFRNKIDL